MKHCADEFDSRWLVGILFLELHDESEGAVFKGGIGRPDDNSVPVRSLVLAINYSVLESDHVMTLSAIGEADTPAGGSVCMRWQSQQLSNNIEAKCGTPREGTFPVMKETVETERTGIL